MCHIGAKHGHLRVDSLQVMDLRKGLEEVCLVLVVTQIDGSVGLLQYLRWYASVFMNKVCFYVCLLWMVWHMLKTCLGGCFGT